jgi:hypothetical protein
MTKLEFITALHKACPAFMKDLKSNAKLIGSMLKSLRSEAPASLSDETLPDPLTEVKRLEVEFQNKWPKWPNYLSDPPPILREPNHFDFDSLMEGLEIFNQAKAANVELDPVLAYREVFRVIFAQHISDNLPESLLEKEMGFEPSKEVTPKLIKDNEMEKNLRQKDGEFLFRRAAIVIPVYAHTNKDDIDWKVIEEFKKRFYGQSYRPKSDQYKKIIKVFRAGQLLEEQAGKEERAYKSWQEVADSVGLRLNAVRYIYDRAHEVVYGYPSEKRRYRSDDTTAKPATVEEVLKDNGPSRREALVSEITRFKPKRDNEGSDENDDTNEIDSFRKVFDELREDSSDLCFICQELKSAGRSDVTHAAYLALGKYSPLPPYPDFEPFICNDCLLKIVSEKTITD